MKRHKNTLWAQELYNFKDHTPETEEYGITSFVYRASAFLTRENPCFFQSRVAWGCQSQRFFWISTRPDFVGELSQAGAFVRHQAYWLMVGGYTEQDRPQEAEFKEMLQKQWDTDYGDRRQEIIFIGPQSEMHPDTIRARLDACLIQDYLAAPETYQKIADPFPQWFEEEE